VAIKSTAMPPLGTVPQTLVHLQGLDELEQRMQNLDNKDKE
jgi:hypothetical protein